MEDTRFRSAEDPDGAAEAPPPASKRSRRTDYAHRQLRQAIKDGRYRPGDWVREAEVAQWLGISRTPVREAMNRLISERLLVDSQSRGTMVVELDKAEVRELYALREVLEGTAAGLAAVHADEEQISSMGDFLAQSKLHFADPVAQQKLNEYFHGMIYEAARNRYLVQALSKLGDALDLLSGTTYQEPGRPELAYEEHAAILDAIRARDALAADMAARRHMREALRVRMRLIFGRKL